jgi:hypothetical protein
MADGVIIIGGGSTGEACVSAPAARAGHADHADRTGAGRRRVFVLRLHADQRACCDPLEAVAAAPVCRCRGRSPAASTPALFLHRDSITSGWDDASRPGGWSRNAELVGRGRVVRPGVVAVATVEIG